jgi:hypothetical protein
MRQAAFRVDPCRSLAGLALLAALAACGADPPPVVAPPPPPPSIACDRDCLERQVDGWLDAVIAHDPYRLAITPGFRFTENGQQLDTGDGQWRSVDGRGSYRRVVADVAAGHVAALVSVREDGVPAMMALRLTIRNRRLAAAETFIQRDEASARGFERLGSMPAVTIPVAGRMTRATLLRTADRYFTGLARNDGQGDYPFTDDCERIADGRPVTNQPVPRGHSRADPRRAEAVSPQWTCREQFESGLLYFTTRVRDRRFVAVDPERGEVFAFAFVDHAAGETRRFRTPDGRRVEAGPRAPWTWEAAYLMEARDERLTRIIEIRERVPYGMDSGWSSWEEGRSSEPRDVTGPAAPQAASDAASEALATAKPLSELPKKSSTGRASDAGFSTEATLTPRTADRSRISASCGSTCSSNRLTSGRRRASVLTRMTRAMLPSLRPRNVPGG